MTAILNILEIFPRKFYVSKNVECHKISVFALFYKCMNRFYKHMNESENFINNSKNVYGFVRYETIHFLQNLYE